MVRKNRFAGCSFGGLDWDERKQVLRLETPLDPGGAKRLVKAYVADYNHCRLHSAVGDLAPADKLAGKAPKIHCERDRILATASRARADN